MGKFNELPFPARVGVLIVIGAVIFAGAWYGPVPGLAAMRTANTAAAVQLKDKQAENAKLRPYEGQLRELNAQIDALQRQMDRQREIVPDAKDADDFIRDMQSDALQAGVEIRSFTAKPVSAKQYYSEAPFDMEIDGPYFAMLNFFEKVGTMERIVNIDDLKMSGIGSKVTAPTKHKYDYAPGESVLVACTAKTFFSHGTGTPAAPAPGTRPGAPAPAAH
jgi:type IV pilus assembly protein PilO